MAAFDKKGKNLLDLATLTERPLVRIDGRSYELLSPDEVTLIQLQQLSTLGNRLNELSVDEDLTTEEIREYGEVIKTLYERIAFSVPDEISARLGESQKLSVIEVFTSLLSKRDLELREARKADQPNRTGAKS